MTSVTRLQLGCVAAQPFRFITPPYSRRAGKLPASLRTLVSIVHFWGGKHKSFRTSLLIPPLIPPARAQGPIGEPELEASRCLASAFQTISHQMHSSSYAGRGGANLAAGSKVLALGENALVVVNVVLPAVLGLVGVREAGVNAYEKEGDVRFAPLWSFCSSTAIPFSGARLPAHPSQINSQNRRLEATAEY